MGLEWFLASKERVMGIDKTIRWVVALTVMVGFLTACGSTSVVVDSDYPEPLTPKMPLDTGIVFDQEFRDYVHMSGKKSPVKLTMGRAQVRLFSETLGAMFNGVGEFSSMDESIDNNHDLTIVPRVEDVQIALPRDTKLEVYEVWIKYNIQVFDEKGEAIGDWIMTSYGKTVDSFLSSKEEAIHQAAVVALRDTGVQLVTKFKFAPGMREWLRERMAKQTVEVGINTLPPNTSTVEGGNDG